MSLIKVTTRQKGKDLVTNEGQVILYGLPKYHLSITRATSISVREPRYSSSEDDDTTSSDEEQYTYDGSTRPRITLKNILNVEVSGFHKYPNIFRKNDLRHITSLWVDVIDLESVNKESCIWESPSLVYCDISDLYCVRVPGIVSRHIRHLTLDGGKIRQVIFRKTCHVETLGTPFCHDLFRVTKPGRRLSTHYYMDGFSNVFMSKPEFVMILIRDLVKRRYNLAGTRDPKFILIEPRMIYEYRVEKKRRPEVYVSRGQKDPVGKVLANDDNVLHRYNLVVSSV